MTNIARTIRKIALADTTVSAVIGSRISTRRPPERATFPMATLRVVDTTTYETLATTGDVARARIQVDAYSEDKAGEANDVAEALRIALQKKHRGVQFGQFINEISLTGGVRESEDPVEPGSDKVRFVASQDFFVFYRIAT